MEQRLAKSVIFGLIAAAVTLMTGSSLGFVEALPTFVIAGTVFYFLYPLILRAFHALATKLNKDTNQS